MAYLEIYGKIKDNKLEFKPLKILCTEMELNDSLENLLGKKLSYFKLSKFKNECKLICSHGEDFKEKIFEFEPSGMMEDIKKKKPLPSYLSVPSKEEVINYGY